MKKIDALIMFLLRHLVLLHQWKLKKCITVYSRHLCKFDVNKLIPEKKLNFSGEIVCLTKVENANEVSEELKLKKYNIFGFDIEWPPQRKKGHPTKTALLQICPHSSVVYLFHIAAMPEFPRKLKELLMDEDSIKAGLGIKNDLMKLQQDFNFKVSEGVVELSDLANDKGFRNQNPWGLQGLVERVLNQELEKNKKITQSNWNQTPLTEDQLRYAALDAYACYVLLMKLISL